MSDARVSKPPGLRSGHIIRDSSLAWVPETLDRYLALSHALWQQGPLNAAEVEMVRLRNANSVNCVFCKSVRYDVAVVAGLTEDKVEQVAGGDNDDLLSEREQLILLFCDHYLDYPTGLSVANQQRLKTEFTKAELLHLSLALVTFNAFSRCAVALGGMPESLPVMQIPLPQ